ncbi:MAG: cell division FtsA domain-containing protein [Bacilli bacterium]|jgi:cell division protein FtsA|nr:cell division FtsA domain-containing protein [Bacilli bacterium]
MEKPVAAIEFGSKKIKLVVGYELDGQVYVLYALTKPYGHIVEPGKFSDFAKLTQNVKEVHDFSDPSAKLKLTISEALLAIPPYGLDVFETKQVTTVIGEESKINTIDIRNIYALIRNASNEMENALIDVIPETYILDQGRTFTLPPIGVSSSTLSMVAKVHTLPHKIPTAYQTALNSGGINVKRLVIAPFAAAKLLASYSEIPNDYILVDIGSDITMVSLIGNETLYASRTFEWGGDHITERIIEAFNINEADAEKYKILYGIDKREMNFRAPVCKTDDGEGHEVKHYREELNSLIKSELETFTKQLNSAVDDLLTDYGTTYKKLPMILVGGGSQLHGLVEYITPKVPSETVKVVTPRSFGARNPTFTNCLGMILAHANNPSVYDENHPRFGQVTRDPIK